MVRLYIKELNATRTNYQSILELRKKVRDKNLRHKIIFYDTLIGCVKARKEYPERFVAGKQVTSEILESENIAGQRQITLINLKDNSPEEILDRLQKEAELLKNERVQYTERLYKKIIGLNSDSIYHIGNNLERSLTKHRRMINKSTGNRRKAMFFWSEGDSIYEVVSNEVERIAENSRGTGDSFSSYRF